MQDTRVHDGMVGDVGFERIRRITGYLVGTMDRWNNAKRAEERDRVKECGDEGTYPYWLRSVSATGSTGFRLVFTDGSGSGYGAHCSHGFAPGFDI